MIRIPRAVRRLRRRFSDLLDRIDETGEAIDAGIQAAVDRAKEKGLPVEGMAEAFVTALDVLTPLPSPVEELSDEVIAALDRYLERKIEAAEDEPARKERLARVDRMRARLQARAAA